MILNKAIHVAKGPWYWLALIVLGLSMESVALMYQYAWEEDPCVLCIHVRLWAIGFVLLAFIALVVRKYWLPLIIAHLLNSLIMVGLFERSYQLLGTERGTIFSDCNFDLGLPDWLAFDQWLPAVFEVQASCGYTPVLLWGITMAEALIVMSAVLMVISGILTIASLWGESA